MLNASEEIRCVISKDTGMNQGGMNTIPGEYRIGGLKQIMTVMSHDAYSAIRMAMCSYILVFTRKTNTVRYQRER